MGECLLVHMLIVVMQKPTKARKGHWSFWVTFVGQFRPIEMGAGNWTHVFCKYSKFSYLRSQLFIPYRNIFLIFIDLPTKQWISSQYFMHNTYVNYKKL